MSELQDTVSTMVVECKKSRKPWVFFSSPRHSVGSRVFSLNFVSTLSNYFHSVKRAPLSLQIENELKACLVNKHVPECVAYHEAYLGNESSRNESHHSPIYKAVKSVISFIDYDIKSNFVDEKFAIATLLYIPVILLDGDLFHASICNNEIELKRAERITLRVLQGGGHYIDVVTKAHFETYVQWFKDLLNVLVTAINSLRLTDAFILKTAIENRRRYIRRQ